MPPDPEITLREFMELRFAGLEKKVESLEKKVDALMWSFIGGVGVAIVIAWLRQALGL